MTDNDDHRTDDRSIVEAYLNGGDLQPELRTAVQSLGATEADARPMLRRVAEASSATGNRKVTFDAVDALWKLGETKAYLLDAVRNHRDNKWLAYHAIVVLGRLTGDHEVDALLTAVKAETSDAHLLGAIAMADRVDYLDQVFSDLPSTDQRMRFVLDSFRTDWNSIKLRGGDVDRGTDPQAIWGQQKLLELSRIDPSVCAGAIARVEISADSAEADNDAYRSYLSQFLSDEARADVARLIEQGGET